MGNGGRGHPGRPVRATDTERPRRPLRDTAEGPAQAACGAVGAALRIPPPPSFWSQCFLFVNQPRPQPAGPRGLRPQHLLRGGGGGGQGRQLSVPGSPSLLQSLQDSHREGWPCPALSPHLLKHPPHPDRKSWLEAISRGSGTGPGLQ